MTERPCHSRAEGVAWRSGAAGPAARDVAVETPVAFSYGGSSHAVMMATPCNLEDFAYGFTLNEGIARTPADILGIDIVEAGEGLDLQITLSGDRAEVLGQRRRALAGPAGCGLCGIETIDAALRRPAKTGAGILLTPEGVTSAMGAMPGLQQGNSRTHAMHAAGFWRPGEGVILVREDVGRHNALDKLAGALARAGVDGAAGAVLMTSRISVELVQKTARIGATALLAVSAPTDLAIRMADEAGILLAAVVRGDEFEVFAHPERVQAMENRHVA